MKSDATQQPKAEILQGSICIVTVDQESSIVTMTLQPLGSAERFTFALVGKAEIP